MIWNNKKANEALAQAQDENKKLKAEVEALKVQLASAGENDSEAVKAADKLEGDLKTAQGEIIRLTQELNASKADANTAREEAKQAKAAAEAHCKEFDEKVKTAAANQAATIVANTGATALTATVSTGGAGKDFPSLVKAQIASGKTKAQAVAFCARNHPAEHAEWLKSGNTNSL